MIIRTAEYPSRAQAQAFVDGVELVNDSALEVVSVRKKPKEQVWVVKMHDHDYHE